MIRPARPGDRPVLRDLQAHLREPNPPLLDYAVGGPPLVLVSTVPQGDPVGYAVTFYDDEGGYVAEIVVAPGYRREGRARRLLTATADRLRAEGCSSVRLAVHPENGPARRLYESLGFEAVGRQDGYYEDGSDAIVMERDLSG